MKMHSRSPIPASVLVAAVGLMAAGGAAAQTYTIPAPSRGEQSTQLLSQPLEENSESLQQTMQELTTHIQSVMHQDVDRDTDKSLSLEVMAFEHIKIDVAEEVLSYAIDPELRLIALNDIQTSAQRIAEFRTWQINRDIVQRQIATPSAR